jgi:hypothetical protein
MPNKNHQFGKPDYSFSSKVVRIPRAEPPKESNIDWPAWSAKMLAAEKRDKISFRLSLITLALSGICFGWLLAGWAHGA